jgi:hypothetical protein
MATGETGNVAPASNRQAVFQAIVDLCGAGRQASRQAVCDFTGLKMTIVDDHVKNLKDDGMIRLVVNGIFEPVDQTPDRAVSGTIVPNGRYKLEIGDTVLDLTLREARNVGLLTGGLGLLQGR